MHYTGHHPKLLVRAVAELLAAGLFAFIGTGVATYVRLLNPRQAGRTAGDLLLVALAAGLALTIVLFLLGKVSGAHTNPAITLALATAGRFPWREVPAYVLAQYVGSVAGAVLILVVYGKDAATRGQLGAPTLAFGLSAPTGLVVEAFGAGILALAYVAATATSRAPANWTCLAIGLTLAVILLCFLPSVGGSLSPATAFGSDLVDAFLAPPVAWDVYAIAYLVGPLVGGAFFAGLFKLMLRLHAAARSAPSAAG